MFLINEANMPLNILCEDGSVKEPLNNNDCIVIYLLLNELALNSDGALKTYESLDK